MAWSMGPLLPGKKLTERWTGCVASRQLAVRDTWKILSVANEWPNTGCTLEGWNTGGQGSQLAGGEVEDAEALQLGEQRGVPCRQHSLAAAQPHHALQLAPQQ